MALKLSYNKRNWLLALVLIGALIVDTLLSNISDILSSQLDTAGGVVLFVALAALVFGSAYYLLIYLKNVSSEPRLRKPVLSTISKMIVRSMFVLIAIVALISLQVIFLSEYSILLFVAATFLGYILGGAIMALLGYYLLRWFMLNKKSIMVALFAAAAFMTAVASACLGISQGGLFLAAGPLVIHSRASINYPNINPELTGIFGNLLSVAYIETMLSYALTWAAASILLYHYSKRIGMKKYLTLVIVPMGAFVIGITPILFSLPTTGTYFDPKLLVFRIVSILSLIAVGILLGLAFRVVVKSIHPHIEGPLIDYLRISSYGLAFLFVILAANIAHGAYPPFGIISYGFTAVASYFFMMGIYSSAVVISTDSEVRRKIRKSTIEQSKLLDNIGSAHMEQELERMVLPMAKKYSEDLAEKSGFELSVEYIKAEAYVKEVIDEIKKQKRSR